MAAEDDAVRLARRSRTSRKTSSGGTPGSQPILVPPVEISRMCEIPNQLRLACSRQFLPGSKRSPGDIKCAMGPQRQRKSNLDPAQESANQPQSISISHEAAFITACNSGSWRAWRDSNPDLQIRSLITPTDSKGNQQLSP